MSLITEKPVVFCPQLAATLGLEEAILLQILHDISILAPPQNQQGGQFAATRPVLEKLAPFWHDRDIQRVCSSLREKGVLQIHSPPYANSGVIEYSLIGHTTPSERPSPAKPKVHSLSKHVKSANNIGLSWQPDQDTLSQLAQYGIPGNFAFEQLPEFVAYWHERNEPRHSWNAKFIKHTLRLWRQEQAAATTRSQEVTMNQAWRPSVDALEILENRAEINSNFIEDAIPEFILYWQERGIQSSTWNSQFIQHVKRQWAKFTLTLEHHSEPHLVAADWKPSEDLFEVLQLANIPRSFAEQEIPPFVLFWRETGHAHNSWNTKFLQHVKRQWAYSKSQPQDSAHGKQQPSNQPISTRATRIVDDLNDRSWAN